MENVLIDYALNNPKILTAYTGLTGAYVAFCAIASFTKSKKDDKVADKLRRFFSIAPKK